MRVKYAAPMAMLAAAMAAGAAHAQVMTETATASFSTGIDFESTYEADLFIDKFDTQGGARELVGIDIYYTREYTGTMFWDANPLATDLVGTQISVNISWEGAVDGVLLPYNVTGHGGHNFESTTGWGQGLAPGEGAGSFEVSGFGGISDVGMNPTDDAALFAALTGTGQAHIDGEVTISEMMEEPLGCSLHDILFPAFLFFPGLMWVEMDTYTLGMQIDYHYVPAPGAVSAFALGGVVLGVRRRRR